jgi:opacity protein-like surface antigen
MKHIIIALVLLGLFMPGVYAGGDKTGEAGFMFLKVPIGARETSMGMTGLTQSQGAAAMFWNPASISHADGITATFSYLSHFAGIKSNYMALAIPVGDIGTFAFNLNYLSYGQIEITTTSQPNGTGVNYTPADMAFGLGYSKQVTDRVSVGVVTKFIYSKIDQVSSTSFAFDFGFLYNTGYRGLKLGFMMSNLGPQAKYQGDGLTRELANQDWGSTNSAFLYYGSEPFEMPAAVNFGISMDVFRNENNALIVNLEQNVNNFQANRSNLGMEYGFNNMFFVRGGYTSAFSKNADYSTTDKMGGMTFGAGLNYKFSDSFGVGVDYGYMHMGKLDPGHRMTVNFSF